MTAFGLDISKWQDPKRLPWSRFKRDCTFLYVRATYGITRDPRAVEHARRIREIGCELGFYHFFRPNHPPHDQLKAFEDATTAAGYAIGDNAPSFDVEDDVTFKLNSGWAEPLEKFAAGMRAQYGQAVAYCSREYWLRLGSPEWLLEYPLWVPHYTTAAYPKTPGGKPWTIWQFRIDEYDPRGPGTFREGPNAIDHDIASGTIPKVTRLPGRTTARPVEGEVLEDMLLPPPPQPARDDGEDEDDERRWQSLRARLATAAIDELGIIREDSLRRDHLIDDPSSGGRKK